MRAVASSHVAVDSRLVSSFPATPSPVGHKYSSALTTFAWINPPPVEKTRLIKGTTTCGTRLTVVPRALRRADLILILRLTNGVPLTHYVSPTCEDSGRTR